MYAALLYICGISHLLEVAIVAVQADTKQVDAASSAM